MWALHWVFGEAVMALQPSHTPFRECDAVTSVAVSLSQVKRIVKYLNKVSTNKLA